ncbi:GMC oxidoreductase [Flagellimonas beolgyonensis]|uniref:GMC oxidoreductase n=1 Tax=Flagellimonas beolgyonensis TaxID=864064 RepID=UPI003D658BA0
MDTNYDIIIVGTGAGGATLALKLADTGKRILLLERGGYVPVERENWDSREVFIRNRYTTNEFWLDKRDRTFRPGQHYGVGGNTKFYGAALFRMREQDFGKVVHHGGISPEWPISYGDLKPYYLEAEHLYHVHGQRGADPTEPPEDADFAYGPLPHESRIQEVFDGLRESGLHPFPCPIGVDLEKKGPGHAPFVLDRFDGFPDPTEHKADAHVIALRKALEYENVRLLTRAKVTKLTTDKSGTRIREIHAEHEGELLKFTAELCILSCGAINSAALLLKSANEHHPAGLGNSSDLVGRNYMCHINSALMAIGKEPNPTKFGKTFAINDFYFASGDQDFDFPLGHIQMLGKSDAMQIKGDSPIPAPGFTFELLAKHAVDFWLATEDLPDPNNRISLVKGQIKVSYTPNNLEAHRRLLQKLKEALTKSGKFSHYFPKNVYFSKDMPIAAVAHQNGTVRFGHDPRTSVLDRFCRSHEVENLFVVDGSFFVSSSAVNPALTIIANALRVGDHIKNEVL